jgi:LysR family transcriptional regulator, glycine cleavage system transcriptional activator
MRDMLPLTALCTFEAAARLGGFARAAAELNMSTSAVSHQIRGLEDRLGARLLERSTGKGGVSVTPAGQRLLVAAREVMDLLQVASSDIRGMPRQLTVSANPSMSAMWLARRLAEFSANHPQTPVSAIQENDPNVLRSGVDLAIVNVKQSALRPDDVVLLREEVFPVCSPALHPIATRAISQCRLLQEAHEDSPEIDWHTWSAELGLPSDIESKIVRYSSFTQVIGAAVGGAGVALGRAPLIGPELESRRLVRLRPHLSRRASWSFVLRRKPLAGHPMLEPLVAFLRSEAVDANAANRAQRVAARARGVIGRHG